MPITCTITLAGFFTAAFANMHCRSIFISGVISNPVVSTPVSESARRIVDTAMSGKAKLGSTNHSTPARFPAVFDNFRHRSGSTASQKEGPQYVSPVWRKGVIPRKWICSDAVEMDTTQDGCPLSSWKCPPAMSHHSNTAMRRASLRCGAHPCAERMYRTPARSGAGPCLSARVVRDESRLFAGPAHDSPPFAGRSIQQGARQRALRLRREGKTAGTVTGTQRKRMAPGSQDRRDARAGS